MAYVCMYSKLILKLIKKIQEKEVCQNLALYKSEANFLVKYREKSTSQIYFASHLIAPFWYKHAFLYKLKLLTAKIAFPSPSSRASSIKAILSVKDLYSSKE